MKKIIFFAYDMNIGGVEKALLTLLNRLVSDYEVSLVLERKRGVLLRQLDGRVRVTEYRTSEMRLVPLRKLLNYCHRMLWTTLHRNRYDFSCSYATYSVIGSRLALACSVNSSLYVHNDYCEIFGGDVTKVKAYFQLLKSGRFQHLLFVSEESKRKIDRLWPERSHKNRVISNLIDAGEIEKKAATGRAKRPNGCCFLFAGRLEEESKRLTRLMEAFAIAHQRHEDYVLWIVGDGKDRDLCRRLIRKYHLSDSVKMFGSKKNPYPYMQAADCVLLTSDYEGYPVLYNECLVLKKPLITTVPVSDPYLDIRDYAIVVGKNAGEIAEAMESGEWRDSMRASLDFQRINENRLEEIKEVIDGK